MRSTEFMMVLPQFPPRLAWLKGFWLVMSMIAGCLTAAVSSLLLGPYGLVLGIILIPALALPGILRPRMMSIPYRAWNKLAYMFAHYARLALTAICFYIIFIAVGRTGASLDLGRPPTGRSLWVDRQMAGMPMPDSRSGVVTEGDPPQGWVSTFLRWAAQTGNWWACCLLPFLMFLSVLENHQTAREFPADIYTLF
jgi:hypothetical protein